MSTSWNPAQAYTATASIPTPAPGEKKGPDLRSWLDRRIRYDALIKLRRDSDNTQATLYRQADQWLQKSGYSDPTKTAHWSPIEFSDPNDPDYIPTPVQPEIVVHLQNESARLGKPTYKPYVRPQGMDPTAEDREGARLGEQLLRYRLDKMRWPDIESDGLMQMPLWGQWITCSEWQDDWLHLKRVPVTQALCCRNHPGAMLGEDIDDLDAGMEGGEEQPQDEIVDTPDEEDIPELQPEATPPPNPALMAQAAGMPPMGPGGPDDAGSAQRLQMLQGRMTEMGMDTSMLGAFAPPAPPQPPPPPPPCDFVAATSRAPQAATDTLGDQSFRSAQEQDEQGLPVTALHFKQCPKCGSGLAPYYPTMEEAQSGQDSYGQPLGEDRPTGDWWIRNTSPYDWFPPAQGYGLTWADLPYWLEVRPVHLSFVARAFQHGDKVRAESPQAIAEWHPLTGERAVMEAGGYGDVVFEDFVRLKAYHEQPTRKSPNGRSIIMAGDQVLVDGDFMVASTAQPGQRYPRAHYDCAVWEPQPNQTWGLSMSKLLRSLQDLVNEALSMEEDRRTRMGVVGWVATRHMNLDSAAFRSGGGAGKLYLYDADPINPGVKPEMNEAAEMPEMGGLQDIWISAMGRISGSNEVEAGGAPAGVSAALAMQFLAEKSGERRAPRIRRIREMLERLYSHGLTLMYHKYLANHTLDYEDTDKRWKQRAFTGLSLNGQTRVQIEPEPEHDTTLQKKQETQDLMNSGFFGPPPFDAQTRALIAERLEIRDLGTMGLQRDAASREFCDLRDLGQAPNVDPSLDDHGAHNDQHGRDMMSDWWRDLEYAAGWQHVLPVIYGWEQLFPMLSQQYVLTLAYPPPLEKQILGVWNVLLQERKFPLGAMSPEERKALQLLLRFRAHYEAHGMYEKQRTMAATGGQTVTAAPAAERETAAGTVATSQAPQAQPGMAMAGGVA